MTSLLSDPDFVLWLKIFVPILLVLAIVSFFIVKYFIKYTITCYFNSKYDKEK